MSSSTRIEFLAKEREVTGTFFCTTCRVRKPAEQRRVRKRGGSICTGCLAKRRAVHGRG